MNIYTVRQATEGLSQLILEKGEATKERGVVIAYDSRHQSPEFALETARVLAHHGIKAYVLKAYVRHQRYPFCTRVKLYCGCYDYS